MSNRFRHENRWSKYPSEKVQFGLDLRTDSFLDVGEDVTAAAFVLVDAPVGTDFTISDVGFTVDGGTFYANGGNAGDDIKIRATLTTDKNSSEYTFLLYFTIKNQGTP